MVTSRAAYSTALAATCLIVLATRVPLGFERIRFRVITAATPAQGQSLAVPLPDLAPLVGSPAAVVMRVRGDASAPTHLALALDDTPLTNVILPPNREIRIDASTRPPAGTGHQLRVTADRSGWEVTYLEVANVHGFSRGLLGFNIVPHDVEHFRRAPWWLSVPMLVGLLALRPRPDWPTQAARRRAHRLGVGLVLVLFLAAGVTDRLTPFKILLGTQTFLLCVAVLYAQRTIQAGRLLWRAAAATLKWALQCYRRTAQAIGIVAARPQVPAALAGVAAIAVSATALALGAHYAGGADSYGYVAQSELWARGQLYVDQPIVSELPPYVDDSVIVPLGFVAQRHPDIRGRMVPSYSPGLPMLMAPLRRAAGATAVYLVVPVLAGLTVWLTFVLGRGMNGDATGVFAALWMASSPAFLISSFNPLSDVPVTACWLTALVVSLRPAVGAAAVAGIATSVAILTRPNLAPLAVLLALPFASRWASPSRTGGRGVELVVFLITASAGPLIVAALYNYWFGSPFTSGYGTTSVMFSPSYILPNLARYPRWFIDTQTLLILAGLGTPLLLRGSQGAPGRLRPAAAAWLLCALAVLVWGAYVAYYFFEAWWYLRFLLPSYPPLIVLAGTAWVFALRRTLAPRTLGTAMLVLIVAHGLQFSRRADVFNLGRGEARYQRVGEFASRSLPEGSVLLSMQHAGSLRYYSGLTILRYDLIAPDRLDDIVAHFQARGRGVYIVLDEWEKQEFRGRFASGNALGGLAWTPFAMSSGGMPVTIYDPRDREAITPAETRVIP